MNTKNNLPFGVRKLAMLAFGLAFGFRAVASPLNSDQFQDINRAPDTVAAVTETGAVELHLGDHGVWQGGGITVTTRPQRAGLAVELAAPDAAMMKLELRWMAVAAPDWKYLGDAWERAYGDLEWKPLDSQRVMPWYFLATNGKLTHGYGVKTSPAAMCYWTVDSDGITLHADVRCGGEGVHLGKRTLKVCTVVCRRGDAEETPFAAVQVFCGQMCPKPRLPKGPVYGFNDWYCSYGKDTAENFLKNAGHLVSLAPKRGVRPFAVVDDGWQEDVGQAATSNIWNRINPNFSKTEDMPQFAKQIRALDARPGLWCRPLNAGPDMPQSWRLTRDSKFLDPTVPEVRTYLAKMIGRFPAWGFELIKHDYTTYDLLGQWGMTMGDSVTTNGWTFADQTKTTAEIIRDLYLDIRKAAGNKTLIIGCNTIGHLSAGIFEMQRIGDDTSGREWDRTLKMGVNCLAFRAPQHDRFFAVDADCAGQTTADSVPWDKNRQWLELLARSGTVLFTSFPCDILNPTQEKELSSALAAAAKPQTLAEPLDWLQQLTPSHWLLNGKEIVTFSW
jgi:alpha-galactosidase